MNTPIEASTSELSAPNSHAAWNQLLVKTQSLLHGPDLRRALRLFWRENGVGQEHASVPVYASCERCRSKFWYTTHLSKNSIRRNRWIADHVRAEKATCKACFRADEDKASARESLAEHIRVLLKQGVSMESALTTFVPDAAARLEVEKLVCRAARSYFTAGDFTTYRIALREKWRNELPR